MAARTFMVDGGGTSRQVKRMFVVDSGGTSRLVKRAFVVDGGGFARLIYSGDRLLYNGTITVGQNTDHETYDYLGWSNVLGMGSRSPGNLTDGKSLDVFDDGYTYPGPAMACAVRVSGFSSNPGSAYLKLASLAGGNTLYGADAGYGYSGGMATWTWFGVVFGFSTPGSSVGVTIIGPP